MSYGGYSRGYRGHSNYGNAFATDWNRDGLITSADFRIGAYHMGLGHIGADVAQSAFRAFDRNHNGYLDAYDSHGAYGHLHRLYY
jgi:hypothetical protein